MANVLFSRTDSPSTKPITDGQIIFDTSGNGKMYLDNGTTRLEMGGAINVDATLDATSTNPIQNKGVAGVMLGELEEIRGVTRKGFLTDALATKTLDAKIGTTDISSIGDGTVTGAISDVNGKLQWHTIDGGSNVVQDEGLKTATEICVFMAYASVIRMAPAEAFEISNGVGVDVSLDANNLHYSNLSYVKLDRTNGKLTSSFQYGQIYTEPNNFIKVYYRQFHYSLH